MAKCVNCGCRRVGKANSDGFARCPDCNCTNIIARPEDITAAFNMQRLLATGWPHKPKPEDT